jgi:hypothetical protein
MAHVEPAQLRRRPIIGYALMAVGLAFLAWGCDRVAAAPGTYALGARFYAEFGPMAETFIGLGLFTLLVGVLWLRR